MAKLLKITTAILGLLFVVLIVFIITFDANRYKEEISEAVEEATGRKLQINGELGLKFFNFPTIKIENVSFSNADWASTPHMVSMELLELDIATTSLVFGNLQINKLTLIKPTIALEVNDNGVANWQLSTETKAKEEKPNHDDAEPIGLSLDGITLEDAALSYVDQSQGQNHQLKIHQLTLNKTAATELALDIDANYQNTPLTLSATTALIQSWLNNEQVPLQFVITANNTTEVKLKGQVTAPMTAQKAALELNANIPALNSLSAIAGSDLPTLGPISLNTQIQTTGQNISLNEIQLQLGQSDLNGQLQLALTDGKPSVNANLSAQLLDIEAILASLATDSKPQAEVTATEADTSAPEPLPISLLSSLDSKLNLAINHLKLPEIALDEIQLEADLTNSELTIKPLKLSVAQGQVEGELYLDARQPKINANTQIDLKQVVLSQLPGIETYLSNSTTDMQLTANISGETVEQIIDSAQAQLQLQMGKTEIKAAEWAELENLATLDHMTLDMALDQSNKSLVLNQLDLVNPIVLAQINEKGAANWPLSSAEVASEQVNNDETETTVKSDEAAATPYQFIIKHIAISQADLSYNDAQSQLSEQLLIESLQLKQNEMDTLDVDSSLSYKDNAVTLSGSLGRVITLLNDGTFPLDLTTTVNGHNSLAIKGQIEAPLSEQEVSLKINSSIPDLAALSALARTELPALKPLSLAAQLNRSGDSISIQDLKLNHGSSDLAGHLTINLAAEQPQINATLTSKLLDLTELPKSEAVEEKQPKDKDAKLFPSDPLPLELLKKLAGEVTIQADKIKTDAMEIDNARLTAKAADGAITFTPLKAEMVGGQLNGYLQLAALEDTAAINTDINLSHIQLDQINGLNEQVTQGGATDVLIQIKGVGKSVSDIMAKSNGVMTLQTAPAELNIKGNLLTSDLLTGLLPSGGDNNMKLDCAVVNYTIKDGMATSDRGIAIVTNKMNIIGSSEINLETEALDINLKPHVHEGLGVSMAELADLISIGGTLANPSMGADMMSTLTTGLEVQTAIATGGLSILAKGLFDKVTADDDPCATALGIKPEVDNSEAGSNHAEPTSTQEMPLN